LEAELFKHACNVRHKIVMHDTVTFGEHGEGSGYRGLNYAINKFLGCTPGRCWEVEKVYTNNNGLTILNRRSNEV
jgi:hypothetical protein